MPGFDFSNAKLLPWRTDIPQKLLFMSEAAWDQGKFVAHFYKFESHTSKERVFRFFRMSCEPDLAILVKDEAFALSIWQKCSELERVKGIESHLIVEDSDWVNSFKRYESYGDSWSQNPMVHYIICCGNDFVHLLSKNEPVFSDLGLIPDNQLERQPNVIDLMVANMDALQRSEDAIARNF